MSPPELLGGAMLAALVLYALLGGADYGAGVLDLLAAGPRREAQRALLERVLGPIWEANHVWLILVVVLLFSAFPPAFAAVSVGLFVPILLLLAGVVLRGAAFTFRAYDRPDPAVRVRWGLVFSAASALAPLALGIIVGAVAGGALRADGGAPLAWFAPFPLATGALALALFTLLAAAYAAAEAARAGDAALAEDFRARALWAGAAVFAAALAAALLSWREAPLVFAGLTARRWSPGLHLLTGAAALTAFGALWRRRYLLARGAAAAQAALIVLGWGAAQHPFLVAPALTLEAASAPRAVQVAVLWALAAGAVLLFPALYLLYRTFHGGRPFAVLDRPAGRRRA